VEIDTAVKLLQACKRNIKNCVLKNREIKYLYDGENWISFKCLKFVVIAQQHCVLNL